MRQGLLNDNTAKCKDCPADNLDECIECDAEEEKMSGKQICSEDGCNMELSSPWELDNGMCEEHDNCCSQVGCENDVMAGRTLCVDCEVEMDEEVGR